jgi:tetratricopeptide (TPR) repeat protein
MKLIQGRTLAQMLHDRRRGEPGSVFNALAVFESVAQGVAYAHARGVIHRDLKLANVMVGAFGEVQVMDWGLAKALRRSPERQRRGLEEPVADAPGSDDPDSPERSLPGTVMGTLAFMPPEQAIGAVDRIDARADVFGLGAVLCTLLTGQPPYVGTDGADLRQRAARGDLADAFARLDGCGAEPDLVALCKRCLAADPADRPADGSAVAAAVAELRLVAEERARRAELQKAQAEVREAEQRKRRRAVQVAAGVVAAVLLLGIAGTTAGLLRAERAKGEALTAKTNAETAADQERKARDDARLAAEAEKKAKDEALRNLGFADRTADVLWGLFVDLDPQLVKAKGDELRTALGKRLVAAAQQLRKESVADPLVMANLQTRLGAALYHLGYFRESVPLLTEALATRKAILGPAHPDVLLSTKTLVLGYRRTHSMGEAVPFLEEALKLCESRFGPYHEETLSALGDLAAGYRDAGQRDRALPLFEEALRRAKAKNGADSPENMVEVGNLAVAYQDAGRMDLALPMLEESLRLCRLRNGPDDLNTLSALNNLALGYQRVGKPEQALPLLVENVRLMKLRHGAKSPTTLGGIYNLALTYLDARKPEQALPLLEDIRGPVKEHFGPEHDITLGTLNRLAGCYRALGKEALAVPVFEELLPLLKVRYGPDHQNTLGVMNNLAVAYQDSGKRSAAIPLLEEALPREQATFGPDNPATLATVYNLALDYKSAGKLEEALPLLRRAAEAVEAGKFRVPDPSFLVLQLLDCYGRLNRQSEYDAWLPRWAAVVKRQSGADSPVYANSLASLSLLLLQRGKWSDAEAALRECLALREKLVGEKKALPWQVANTRSMLGGALLGQRKYADAEPLLLAGYAGLKGQEKTIPKEGRIRLPEAALRLVRLSAETGRPAEAAKWLDEAWSWAE